MASRFTVQDKWSDKWFRSLPPQEKLIWIYLCDNCNLAGFWEIDFEKLAFDTGIKQSDLEGAFQGLNRGFLEADGYIWIKNFLRHQRNLPLTQNNPAHKHIIEKFKEQAHRFSLSVIEEKIGAIKGLLSSNGIGKGKGRGKKEVEGENKKPLTEQFTEFNFDGFEPIKEQALKVADIIDKNFRRVQQLEEPLTPTEVCKLIQKGGSLVDVLRDMDNHKELLKKYTSAYKTALNWLGNRSK